MISGAADVVEGGGGGGGGGGGKRGKGEANRVKEQVDENKDKEEEQ